MEQQEIQEVLNRAANAFNIEEFSLAEELLSSLLKEGENYYARILLGAVYGETGHNIRSINQFKRALKLDPDSHEALNNLGIMFKKNTLVAYYDSGTLKKAIISEPVIIDGIPYTNGTIYEEENGYWGNTGIHFYESGEFKAANLVEDATVKGLLIEGDNTVEFHKSGNLQPMLSSTT